MATKKLAKELGFVRKHRKVSSENHNGSRNKQLFSYLIVIDFESTCWREKNSYGQEIIEFPAVLLNTFNGKIESEFHTFVQPQEHPKLSEFCTELTGIRQTQVEGGIPLRVCLSQFTRWLQTLQQEKDIVFEKENVCSSALNRCAFVTWSDWDLGVCLQFECKRKQIFKPEVLNRWIDLRATYKLFYNRKPKGLNGALQDLGIEFSGREHSGLDDARNTARLAWTMITDGCLMKVTKTLERAPLKTWLRSNLLKSDPGNVENRGEAEEQMSKSNLNHPGPQQDVSKILEVNLKTEPRRYRSLVVPKTLLNGSTTPVVQEGKRSEQKSLGQLSIFPVSVTAPLSTSLVLVSTTFDCITGLPQVETDFNLETLVADREDSRLLTETEESCSYDDMLLEDDTSASFVSETYKYVSRGTNGPQQKADIPMCANSKQSNHIVFKSSNTTVYSHKKVEPCPSGSSAFKTPVLLKCKLKTDTNMSNSNGSLSAIPKEVVRGPRRSSECSQHNITGPISSVTACMDESFLHSKSRLSSGCSHSASSLVPSSFVNRTSIPQWCTGKITSPLCGCGRRAKRLTVANGGPNHGRNFYCCPIGKTGCGNKVNCGFFKWESALLKATSSAAASVSMVSEHSTSFRGSLNSSNSSNKFKSLKDFVLRSLRY